jgi:hypothetical protein
MPRRTHSLIHRGYLYAQKHVKVSELWPSAARSELRITHAEAWKQGYLQARRDAKKA